MSATTLYGILRPIIFLVNLYRVKERPGESVRWVTKGMLLVFCLNFSVVLMLCSGITHGKADNLDTYRFRIKLAACALCFAYFNWRIQSINILLTTLKTVETSTQNEKAFSKVRRVLFFAFGIIFVDNLYQLIKILNAMLSVAENYYSVLLFLVIIAGPMLTYFITLLPCVIVTFFICLVVYYVSLSFDGPMEELKRCKSPLRRTKMTYDLIRHFYHSNKMTREINNFGAPLMFILKITAILQFFSMVYYWENERQIYIGDMISIYPTFIYLWYLRSAPSANSKLSQLYRTLLESVMKDDFWMSRDPISRFHLLRLRLSQLELLTHLSLGQTQFTILNEPVDQADVFLFFVEMNDTWNMIYTAKS